MGTYYSNSNLATSDALLMAMLDKLTDRVPIPVLKADTEMAWLIDRTISHLTASYPEHFQSTANDIARNHLCDDPRCAECERVRRGLRRRGLHVADPTPAYDDHREPNQQEHAQAEFLAAQIAAELGDDANSSDG